MCTHHLYHKTSPSLEEHECIGYNFSTLRMVELNLKYVEQVCQPVRLGEDWDLDKLSRSPKAKLETIRTMKAVS